MGNTTSKKVIHTTPTKGMWLDSLPSMQPVGFYGMAFGVSDESDLQGYYGISQDLSNEIHTRIPNGFEVRGIHHLSDRDQFVVMLYDKKKDFSEIGIIDKPSKQYSRVTNDDMLGGRLCFSNTEWIRITSKPWNLCDDRIVYWTANTVYRFLNIDNPLIAEIRLEDTELFKCISLPAPRVSKHDTGGADLPNGAYQYVAQLTDADNNVTNWFSVGNPVYLASKRAVPGDPSGQSVHVTISFNEQFQYDRVRLAVIRTIDGRVLPPKELVVSSYGPGGFSYWHITEAQGTGRTIDLVEVLGKQEHYMKGSNLTTYDDRLVLWDLVSTQNIDMQRMAMEIDVSWGLYKVPADKATDVKGLMGGEVVDIGIRPNYCDGTRGPVFHIGGRLPDDYDLDGVSPSATGGNCSECEQPRWKVMDTSWTEHTHCDLGAYGEFSRKQDRPRYAGGTTRPVGSVPPPAGGAFAGSDIGQGAMAMAVILPDGTNPNNLRIPPTSNSDQVPPNVRGCKYTPTQAFMTVWEHPVSQYCGGWSVREWQANKMGIAVDSSTEEIGEDHDDTDPTPYRSSSEHVFALFGPVIDFIEGTVHTETEGEIGHRSNETAVRATPNGTCFDCGSENPALHERPVTAGSQPCVGGDCLECNPTQFQQSTCQGCSYRDLRWCKIEAAYGSGVSCSGSSVKTRSGSCGSGGCSGGNCGGPGPSPGPGCSGPDCLPGVPDNNPQSRNDPSQFDGNPGQCIGPNCGTLGGGYDDPNFDVGGGNCSSASCGQCGGCAYKADEFDGILDTCGTALGYITTVRDKLSVLGKRRTTSLKTTCEPIPIYDDEGCYIVGYDFPIVQEGKMSYWEAENITYPTTRDCVGRYIFGPDAGKKVRRHKLPSRQFHPHVWSEQTGVVSNKHPGNDEANDTDLFYFGLILRNVKLPDNPPKPYCPNNPFTIMIRPRTEDNKSVIAKGIAPGTFSGEVYGDKFSVPKNGVNSLEFFDRHIRLVGEANEGNRGGENNFANGYMFISPDTLFDRPPLNVARAHVELNFMGQGYRYGLYAQGKDPASAWGARVNQRGYRGAVNLNHPTPPFMANNGGGFYAPGSTQDFRCVSGVTYVPGDSVVSKGDTLRQGVMNLKREKSVYFELADPSLHIQLQGWYTADGSTFSLFDSAMGGQYNGKDAPSTMASGRFSRTSDGSFFTDVRTEEGPIIYAEAPYVSLLRHNPDQYGGVESAQYETLYEGTPADLDKGEVSILNGDTFIGKMTVRRTSYVSENVGNNLNPGDWGDVGSFLGFSGDCGEVPVEDQVSDPRRYAGPRSRRRMWTGEGGYPGFENIQQNGHTPYFPGVQKTLVHFWVESAVNVNHRQYGDELNAGEAVYGKLTEIGFDSNTPYSRALWEDKWMNRFYVEMPELTTLQKIMRVLLSILFIVVAILATILLVIALILEIILAVFKLLFAVGTGIYNAIKAGVNWLLGKKSKGSKSPMKDYKIGRILDQAWRIFNKFWDVSSKQAMIDKILGIRQCLNDDNMGGNDRWLRQWEDNYYRYSYDYSVGNRIEPGYGIPHNYYVCDCFPENICDLESEHPRGPFGAYNNRLVYSNKQALKSPVDGWRNFKVNNYLDVPAVYGKLNNVVVLNNRIFLHTNLGIINVHSQPGQLEVQGDVVYLGRGDLFNKPSLLYGGVVEGVGGLDDPNAAIVTKYGYIFPDRESRELMLFDGGAPTPVSEYGVRYFMRENMPLRILQHFPLFRLVDQKSEYGAGYSVAVDYGMNRILFTKRDWVPKAGVDMTLADDRVSFVVGGKKVLLGNREYFDEVSFTLLYNPKKKEWRSFAWYMPLVYAWDRHDLFSFGGDAMWVHNVKGSFLNYYGKQYPMIVDVHVNDENHRDAFRFVSAAVDTEAAEYRGGVYVTGVKKTFTHLVASNNWQTTGELTLRDRSVDNPLARAKEQPEVLDTEFDFRRWNFADLFDRTVDNNEPLFLPNPEYGPPIINLQNVNQNELRKNIFYDNFITLRFIYRSFADNLKLMFKGVLTTTDYEPRNF